MAGASSHKEIVFVFNHTTGDAASRKKNLSAINTQVAYRAHERRREKKNRQRAQNAAAEEVKPDQLIAVPTDSAATPAKIEHGVHAPIAELARYRQSHGPQLTLVDNASSTNVKEARPKAPTAEAHRSICNTQLKCVQTTNHRRRDADQDSDVVSEHSAIWSASSISSRYSSPSTELTAISPATTVQINGYFDTALDPFFRLPTIASGREKWLVHFYFKEMGHLGFGTHQNSLFCPDRDWVSKYVSTKPLCFQWVLILAEEHLCRMGVPVDQNHTIGRKAKAYSTLNSILKSRDMDLDERLSGIMFAAIVDAPQTNLHLQALDRLIGETGGLDSFMDGPLGITHPEHISTSYAFGVCPIIDAHVLEDTKSRFIENLRLLYAEAKFENEEKLRLRTRRPLDANGRQIVDSNDSLIPSGAEEHFSHYTKAQQDALSTDCLAQLLNSTLNTAADYSSQARHVACVLQVLMILHEFRGNYFAKATFLRRLQYMAQQSTARHAITGQAYLSHAGLLLINACVRQEVQTYVDKSQELRRGIAISKVVIDALKIVPLLSLESRALVVSWMRDWLCHNECFGDPGSTTLTEPKLDELADEISNNWEQLLRPG